MNSPPHWWKPFSEYVTSDGEGHSDSTIEEASGSDTEPPSSSSGGAARRGLRTTGSGWLSRLGVSDPSQAEPWAVWTSAESAATVAAARADAGLIDSASYKLREFVELVRADQFLSDTVQLYSQRRRSRWGDA